MITKSMQYEYPHDSFFSSAGLSLLLAFGGTCFGCESSVVDFFISSCTSFTKFWAGRFRTPAILSRSFRKTCTAPATKATTTAVLVKNVILGVHECGDTGVRATTRPLSRDVMRASYQIVATDWMHCLISIPENALGIVGQAFAWNLSSTSGYHMDGKMLTCRLARLIHVEPRPWQVRRFKLGAQDSQLPTDLRSS